MPGRAERDRALILWLPGNGRRPLWGLRKASVAVAQPSPSWERSGVEIHSDTRTDELEKASPRRSLGTGKCFYPSGLA